LTACVGGTDSHNETSVVLTFNIDSRSFFGSGNSGIFHCRFLPFCFWAVPEDYVSSPVTVFPKKSGSSNSLADSLDKFFSSFSDKGTERCQQ
jgi:hypothetical protein